MGDVDRNFIVQDAFVRHMNVIIYSCRGVNSGVKVSTARRLSCV